MEQAMQAVYCALKLRQEVPQRSLAMEGHVRSQLFHLTKDIEGRSFPPHTGQAVGAPKVTLSPSTSMERVSTRLVTTPTAGISEKLLRMSGRLDLGLQTASPSQKAGVGGVS